MRLLWYILFRPVLKGEGCLNVHEVECGLDAVDVSTFHNDVFVVTFDYFLAVCVEDLDVGIDSLGKFVKLSEDRHVVIGFSNIICWNGYCM